MSSGAILVTGALGYIGLALVRALGQRPIVAFGHAARNPQAATVLPAHVRVIVGELSEVGRALDEAGPVEAVIHLAGGGGPQKCSADPVAAVRANVRGTTELAQAARAHGVKRLVYASTIAVYGTYRDHGRPYAESDTPLPDDLYGALKEAAEHAWTALAGGVSLRLANVYGAGAGVDMGVNGAVERFARAAATGGGVKVFGSGAQRIDYVHVDDVCAAFLAALTRDQLPPAINIGGGAPVSLAEMAELALEVGRELGTPPTVERLPPPEGKAWPDRSLAIDLARSALDWAPRQGFREGFRELAKMMRPSAAQP